MRRLRLAILISPLLSLTGCASSQSSSEPRPELPPLWHFMDAGSTNTVVVPTNCKYGVWTTDTGVKALQGIF